jgi:bifunctional aspartokinase / homoserine dehydrogenase 1
MKVLKFGGTSVGSADAIKKTGQIIAKSAATDQLVVVVSAFSGITNRLIEVAELALNHDITYEDSIDQIKTHHLEVAMSLGVDKTCIADVNLVFNQLSQVAQGVFLLKELTERTRDFILSSGERLSSCIIADYLKTIQVDVQLFDSSKLIVTDKNFGNANVNFKVTKERLLGAQLAFSQVNLFPGFIASTESQEISTLGRGGSDYTASLLSNVLGATSLEIWTDVNGLMTADPRLVATAQLITHLSYEEALELSHFGAKVLYPPSIQPALEAEIPLWVKNTFDPEGPSTLVTKEWDNAKQAICGISSIPDISLVNLAGASMVGIPSFSFRLFKALSQSKINVIMITQASSEHSISVGVSSVDLQAAIEAIHQEFEVEISLHKIEEVAAEKDLSIIALVGSHMRNQVGVSGKMFNTLGRNGISVKAIAQGSSERNITAVIYKKDLKKALNTLHESFFLSEVKKVNLFIVGVGNVGKAFINQLKKQQPLLVKEFRIDIQVTGIANSRTCYFEEEGMNLDSWPEHLAAGQAFEITEFIEEMKSLNLRNSVFIDITASASIASVYLGILQSSISVITPNKIAATREMDKYLGLKWATKKYGSQFLFETNVAAGLPVISTLNDLFKSGDRVLSIEAVLSGTLNYLFNNYDGTKPFSSIVKDAKALGLTEPDPRLDLSGEDVMRKLLILMRESGRRVEMNEIALNSFLPEACTKANDLDDFYQLLDENEAHFQAIYEEAKAEGKQLRVVASFKNGTAKVGLEKVAMSHPFYYLEGKDNIVLFHTERYKEQPLVVKGAGAGAEVTASGIFADVLRIANQ